MIIMLALVLLILGSTSIYAYEGTCSDKAKERVERYIDTIDSILNILERLNAENDPQVEQLIADAMMEISNARECLNAGDCQCAIDSIRNASQYAREVAGLLDVDGDDLEAHLRSKLKRLNKVQTFAEAFVERLGSNDIETPRLDSLLLLSQDALNSAQRNIDAGRYQIANEDLNKARGYLSEAQQIFKESTYKYQFKIRLERFIEKVPDMIDKVRDGLEDMKEQGLDIQRAEELLNEYSELIENATTAYEEGSYEDCIRAMRSSTQVWRELVEELRSLHNNLNGAM